MDNILKIYDLTRGKYPQIYDGKLYDDKYLDPERLNIAYQKSSYFYELFKNHSYSYDEFVSKLLEIPFFLAESTMANESISVQDNITMHIPCGKTLPMNKDDFDINKWLKTKEVIIAESNQTCFEISDLFGVYVHDDNNDLVPCRVFIWVDRIIEYAQTYTKQKEDETSNTLALFDFVLYHEIAHVVMDVSMYGISPAPHFSYANDFIYRFVEEAYADALALYIVRKYIKPSQRYVENTRENFILRVLSTYNSGYQLALFWRADPFFDCEYMAQWMCIKVLFNHEFALTMKSFWHYECFEELRCFYFPGIDGLIGVKNSIGEYGVIDKNNNVVIPFEYSFLWCFDKSGMCKAAKYDKLGIIDRNNNVIIPFEYKGLHLFDKSGLASAQKYDYDYFTHGKWGCIDKNNAVVIPFEYDDAMSFNEFGLAMAMKKGKVGIINRDNEVVVSFEYDKLNSFDEFGHAKAVKGGKWGVVDKNFNVILSFEYDDIGLFDKYELAKIVKSGKSGYVDRQYSIVIPCEYDSIEYFEKNNEGLVKAVKDKKNGIIDRNNNIIIPFEYDKIENIWYYYSSNIFKAKKNGKWGYIDRNNKVVVPFDYENIRMHSDKLFKAKKDGKWGYIDRNNKIVVPFEYAFEMLPVF